MRLLLDTHIWLWSRLKPTRLTQRVSRALEGKDNELWLSPLSLWEVLMLAAKGRVSLAPTAEEWVTLALKRVPMKEATLTSEVALATQLIDLPERDPVDKFLAATARIYELTLVTADARLLQGKGFSVLANH